MGLGNLLTRALKYDVTDTVSGKSETFTILDRNPLAPTWSPRGDYRGALGLPGAWRCAVLLSDLLGGIPWDALAGDRVVASSLLAQPCPPDTRIDTFSAMLLDLLFHGNAIAVYTSRDADGFPTSMLPVPAESVYIWRHREGDEAPPPDTEPGEIVYQVGGRRFRADEVCHIKGPSRPGALRGMGVLEAHLETLKLGGEQQRQAQDISEAAVPTGVLKSDNPDLTQPEADLMKARFREAQRQRTVAVLKATEYQAVSWNPTETQLLEARKFTLHELGLIFGLPLGFLGVETGSLTYSNIETEALNLVKFSVGGWLARFEQRLSLAHRPGVVVKANLDALLRADTRTRYEAHEIGIRAGFLTRDEARELEDRPPLTPEQRDELLPPRAPAPDDEPDEDDDTDPGDEDDDERAAFARELAAAAAEHRAVGDGVDLAHWWKFGPGRKKWVGHPHPWTALFRHLRKHIKPAARAKRVASQWFHDVYGYWPGSRKGSNPTGPG